MAAMMRFLFAQTTTRRFHHRHNDRQSRTKRLAVAPTGTRGWLSIALFVSCVATLLAGCSVQSGGDELAFLRGGALWVARADGSHARELVAGNVVGYAWAPNHQELIARYAASGVQAPPAGSTRGAPAARGNLVAVSINGGYPLQITPADAALERGDAWWDGASNRVVYSEQFANAPGSPSYVVSQIDQPAGIARKTLLDAASIPVLSPNGARVAVIDPNGDLRLGAPSAQGDTIASKVALILPDISRPAHLLWQPQHDAVLFPVASTSGGTNLALHDLHGDAHIVVNAVHLLDAAFSPNGALLVVHTTESLAVFDSSGAQQLSWDEREPLALVWWSPDSKRLLVQDANGLTLVDVTRKAVTPLLVYRAPLPAQPVNPSDSWHPATGSPWSPDGSHIVFACESGASWHGKALPQPKGSSVGLYVAALTGVSGDVPTLIDSHADTAPSWSTPDPSSAFLMSA